MLISRAIAKYGKENFTIEEIDGANSLSELNYLEKHYICKFNSLDKKCGYNVRPGGSNSTHSLSSRLKISKKAKGRKPIGRTVINIDTGQEWKSIAEAARKHNLSRCTLSDYLYAKVHNPTSLRLKNQQELCKPKIKCNKPVININTGKVYLSISEASREENINRITLNYKLLNRGFNDTDLRFYKD